MSTLAYSYSEPYKFPAGVLALAVHGVFFALIYFGVNWRTDPPLGMVVDIWDSLPAPVGPAKAELPPVPQMESPKPVETPKVAEPVVPPKAEIELADKKRPKIKSPEPAKAVAIKPVQVKKTGSTQVDPQVLAAQAAQAELDRARAAQDAAIGKMVAEYKLKIISKIKRNIVMPPDVPDDAETIFDVTLLPGGEVMNARLAKPSGDAAWDSAVERGILRAHVLPLPPEGALFNKFRDLHLTFRPKEKE